MDKTTPTITDDISTITINKELASGGAEEAKADDVKFELKAKTEGVTLEGVKGVTVDADDNTKATFEGAKTEIKGLKDGEYTLEETAAPDGYTVVSTFTFEVKNGVVKALGANTTGDVKKSEDGKSITITDNISTITINKELASGGAEEPKLSRGGIRL